MARSNNKALFVSGLLLGFTVTKKVEAVTSKGFLEKLKLFCVLKIANIYKFKTGEF